MGISAASSEARTAEVILAFVELPLLASKDQQRLRHGRMKRASLLVPAMRKTVVHRKLLGLRVRSRPLYTAAGMPRSGSTLLFNLLREILRAEWAEELSSGWIGDVQQLPKGKAYLVKLHAFDPQLRRRATKSFCTYRDVRVAVVSAFRKFGVNLRSHRSNGGSSSTRLRREECDLLIRYEDLVVDPEKFTRLVAEALGTTVDVEGTTERVLGLQSPPDGASSYSKETLLHPGHKTGTGDNDWRDVLESDLVDEINSQFQWWFAQCQYPLS